MTSLVEILQIAPDIFSVYEKNQKMISDLNQHLSKYGCQPLDMQKEGSSNDSQTLDRGQKLQSHEKKMVEEATFSVTDTLSKSSAHDSLSTTPKLDFKKISNATKKVLRQVNQEDQEEKLPRPTTPQLTITKIEHSTPETPPLPDINLTYFQLLQTKANQKRIPMSLLQTPEILTTATHDNIKSCISTPEPDMPNLSCDLTTTVMMKATGEMERIGELLDSQMTPEKSFYRDLEQENDSGDDIDDILNLSNAFSPPKTSKILQPRKNHSQGWIPLVSDAEWFHAPVFLQKQVSLL